MRAIPGREKAEKKGRSRGNRSRLLSVSEGQLKRSRKAVVKSQVESIPPVSLSRLEIFGSSDAKDIVGDGSTDEVGGTEDDDDYDALFSTNVPTYDSEFGITEQKQDTISFDSLDSEMTEFSLELADSLSQILHYTRLPDMSDIDQVRLLAVAYTVARTKMSFTDMSMYSSAKDTETPDLGTSVGAGYAAVSFRGIGGGEAMDACGLRYLLALHNYLTLCSSLPEDVIHETMAPRDIVWAFHSDAETELLSNITCIQQDRLNWEDLRDAGIGWWIRSNDTLRRIIEKVHYIINVTTTNLNIIFSEVALLHCI